MRQNSTTVRIVNPFVTKLGTLVFKSPCLKGTLKLYRHEYRHANWIGKTTPVMSVELPDDTLTEFLMRIT